MAKNKCQCEKCLSGFFLEEGKYYVDRGGDKYGPMSRRESEDPEYPWCRKSSCMHDEVQLRYTDNGRCNIDPVDDLIEEAE